MPTNSLSLLSKNVREAYRLRAGRNSGNPKHSRVSVITIRQRELVCLIHTLVIYVLLNEIEEMFLLCCEISSDQITISLT